MALRLLVFVRPPFGEDGTDDDRDMALMMLSVRFGMAIVGFSGFWKFLDSSAILGREEETFENKKLVNGMHR